MVRTNFIDGYATSYPYQRSTFLPLKSRRILHCMEQEVAIKQVMPGRRKKRLGPWEIKQLVREARAASCVRHVNVMQCYAYHRGAKDRRFFLVMELLQGPNLEQVLSYCHRKLLSIPFPCTRTFYLGAHMYACTTGAQEAWPSP